MVSRVSQISCYFFLMIIGMGIGQAEEQSENMTQGKVATINQIRSLMEPETKIKTKTLAPDQPYLKIIEGINNDFSTIVYRCRNTKSKSIVDAIESVVSKEGSVEESKDENLLIIRDRKEMIQEIRKIIIALDVTVPQILVEAKVIEVYTQDSQSRNLEWDINKGTRLNGNQEGTSSFPASGSQPDVLSFTPFSAGISGSFDRLHVFLNWLSTVNDAKVLSSPNLTVSVNSTGSIVTGEDLPIQSTSTTGSTVNTDIKYKRTGIQLEVTPLRINSNTVKLQVTPQVSTVTRYESFNDTRTPVVSIRNVQTELTVQDGEIIMLGGLYSSEELKTEKKVPLLGDIPLLGYFFTSQEESTVLKQLIFLLKVSIISTGEETFVDLDQQAEALRKGGNILYKNLLEPEKKASKQKTERK